MLQIVMYNQIKGLRVLYHTYCSVDDSPNILTGTAPGDSNVMMNSSLFSHFMSGAGYPIGGASQIAQNIIPVIERAGGRVLVRARG